jgi:Flp pilus assembly pilin Flp
MPRAVTELLKDDAGQGLPEYAMMTAAVVVLVISAMLLFRADLQSLISATGDYLSARL